MHCSIRKPIEPPVNFPVIGECVNYRFEAVNAYGLTARRTRNSIVKYIKNIFSEKEKLDMTRSTMISAAMQ